MNNGFESIQTVQDLLKLAENHGIASEDDLSQSKKDLAIILKIVSRQSPRFAKETCLEILAMLAGFHHHMKEANTKENDVTMAIMWGTDAILLDQLYDSLSSIVL